MSAGNITPKQREILEYIKEEILKRGYPPTVRDICDAVGLKSTSSVHSHLESLEKKGAIKRDPAKPRAIEICDDSFQLVRTEVVSLPVVGQVAAGQPILAQQNIDTYFPLPAEYVPGGESFILKVKGDSMINVGIFNGDYIFVNVCNSAKNGDITKRATISDFSLRTTQWSPLLSRTARYSARYMVSSEHLNKQLRRFHYESAFFISSC